MKKYCYSILIFSIGFFCGCHDAPRDNLLDPQSPQYVSTASVIGTVSILNQNTPLPSATITSMENGISTISNASGVFSFDRLTIGTQTLICTKLNYTPDTQRIVLYSQTIVHVRFSLNGAPYVVSQNIYTRKIDQYYPSPQYFVDVTASVADPNGITDIDSVWFFVTYSSSGSSTSDTLFFPMTYSVSTRLFQVTLYKYDLPTNTIQWLVNRPLQIKSRDIHYAINYSNPFYVSRVIENTAIPTYPTINTVTSVKDTTGPTPLLQWSPPDVTFNYTYSLTISRIVSGVSNDVWSYSQLGSINDKFQFPGDNSGETLDSGEYMWTISVVDDFGNYSRSKEASFVVK
ncbi:MAG: carboxypeptidase-like regulatory domain-containing protein [Bacteroidota bacterium]